MKITANPVQGPAIAERPLQKHLPPGLRRRVDLIVALAVLAVTVQVAAPPARADSAPAPACSWMDTTKNADERANLLLDASTLDQTMRWLNEASANETNLTTFGSAVYPDQLACVPFTADDDGPFGVAYTPGVTAFPVPVAQAASWDTGLSWKKGAAQADEAFRKRYNTVLGPAVDIARSPWSGRNAESLGEDPLLSGTLAGDWVNGLRDGNPGEPVAAVLKHFVGNNQELDRATSSSNMDSRTLHEVYGMPFQIANDTSGPAGVMCSYNQVNGTYSCENHSLLTDYVKNEVGFKGYVVTDNGSQHSTAASLNAGLDQELSQPNYFSPANLHAALDDGEITEAQIRAAAFRVVRAKFANRQFDNPLPATAEPDVRTAEHHNTAEKIAEEGSVLLKNNGKLLPLSGHGKTIAVIGPTASNTPTNGVSAKTVCTGPLYGQLGAPTAVRCPDPSAPLDAITARAAKDGDTVVYNNGSDPVSAAATAASADIAIVFGYNFGGEYFDLSTPNLLGGGDALIKAVSAANPHTVAVLENVGPVVMPWIDSVPSVLEAWYPGEAGGDAIAALLFGDANPSGKLPVTFPKSVADLPTGSGSNAQYPGVFADGSTTRTDPTAIRQVSYSEGLGVGYKSYDVRGVDPLFEFGHGLSYTTFKYSALNVTTKSDPDTGAVKSTVRFTLKNTGSVPGAEVPQAYLTFPGAADEPGKRLVGFDRIQLAPGESRKVEVVVDSASANRPFSIWNDANGWRVVDGSYRISVGSSSRALPLQKSVAVDLTRPVATTPPAINGNPRLGSKLSASSGVWSETGLKFTYQWMRAGKPIAGATGSNYRVTSADQGTRLSVRVLATPTSGPAGTATSPEVVVRTTATVLVTPQPPLGTTTTNFSVAVKVVPWTVGLTPSGSVTISVDDRSVTGTLAKGQVVAPIGKLGRGIHKVAVHYTGSDTVVRSDGHTLITVTR
ncbi:beta-glucosidase [Streptomyces mirabilis]|uniref:beta-glucosidase n=1 Tax=Streptomyces mirabilis TaxID=68239 RepID=UPI00365A12FC